MESGQRVSEAARSLGIVEQTLANWVKAHRAGKLRGSGRSAELTAEQMEIRRLRAELARVDISHRGKHVASHARSYSPGHTTNPLHRHPRHTAYDEWSAEEALATARALAPACGELLAKIFAIDNHIDHQRRASQALSRMAREYGQGRLTNACAMALDLQEYKVTFIRNVLRNNREALPLTGTEGSTVITEHANLRSNAEFSIHIVPKRSKNADQ